MDFDRQFGELADEHRQWLRSFDAQYLASWEKLFAANCESALSEAAVRRLLHEHGVEVEPNENLTPPCGGPDFRCTVHETKFYVEVACVEIETATACTGLPNSPQAPARHYSSLNDAFWSACKNKASQCGNLNWPSVIAVGTFHEFASVLCVNKLHATMLLTGETSIAWNVSPETGSQVGDTFIQTDFYSATFLRRDPAFDYAFARKSISAVLICGFGARPCNTVGLLHPAPARPFEPALLPGIEFGKIEFDRVTAELSVCWQGGD